MKRSKKMVAMLLSAVMAGSCMGALCAEEVSAEELPKDSFVAEVYTEDTHMNYQVPMSYTFDIDIRGNVIVTISSDENFTADGKSTKWKVEMPLIKLTTERIAMNRTTMFYCDSDKSVSSFKQYSNMNCTGSLYSCYGELSQSYSVLTLYGVSDTSKTKPLKMSSGVVSTAQIFNVRSTLYTDTDGRFFIKDYDGNKDYFSDTITIECNGVTISKAIGSDAEGQTPDVTETDEAKIARLESEKTKLENDLKTANNRIDSLNEQYNNLQAQLYEQQINSEKQAGDINKDGFTNASDAALILQYAAYVGAGGTLDLQEWFNSPYRSSMTVGS